MRTVDLIDSDGFEMQAFLYGENASSCGDQIEEQNVYYFSGGFITKNKTY